MNMPTESNLIKAYVEAYRLASEKISRCNPEEVAQNSNTVYDSMNNTIEVKYFNTKCRVVLNDGTVSPEDTSGELNVTEKVLILHYLIHAQPIPLSGRNISFLEITGGGSIYYPAFKKRAIDPLVKTFSNKVPDFPKVAAGLSGIPERYGTVSSTLNVFPLVPVTYVLWQGDEEVPATGNILFDASVTGFLPVEDIVLAGSFGVYRLINASRT